MLKKILHIKLILLLVFIASFGVTFASTMASNAVNDRDKDKDKGKEALSLKNIQRPSAFFSLSSHLTNVETENVYPSINRIDFLSAPNVEGSDNSVNINSTIRIKTGNSTVVYPYSYKLKPTPFSLFKTPTGR